MENFDAIIFDLGGVILNIDYNKTCLAFEDLGLKNFSDLYSQASQSGLFDRFETGQISTQFFINELLPYLPKGTSANELVHAWNAMILDFPDENLALLQRLRKKKKIFLLSNTNEIHIQCFHRKLAQKTNFQHLNSYFDFVYFSNEINMRKPDESIFEFVCQQQKLHPEKTLFIDDSIQHVEGAKKMGLQTYHLTNSESIISLF